MGDQDNNQAEREHSNQVSLKHGNPYDYASPVNDIGEFADRYREIVDIVEYLELSKDPNASYYNLALIGPRASGKTSLVNIIREISDEMGFLPVKISLNEEVVAEDIEFFNEMLDGILEEGVEYGMYGGPTGKVYRNYQKLINTLEFDVTFQLPFNFGGAYVGSQKNEEKDRIKQRDLIEDLEEFSEEAQEAGISTIVLLIDEAELLSENKALLQKLRNVFEEVEGYILVLAGTEEMFEQIGETFSPIPRSFKKIPVRPFEEYWETAECVLKPLPEEEEELIDQDTIRDIHNLTNGSPHEINLVCHQIYRQYLYSDDEELTLSADILDRVLTEITSLTHKESEKKIKKIRQLSELEQEVIGTVLEVSNMTKDEVANLCIFNQIDLLQKGGFAEIVERNKSILGRLQEKELISSDFQFKGNEMERLYLKYLLASELDHELIIDDPIDKEKTGIEYAMSKVHKVLGINTDDGDFEILTTFPTRDNDSSSNDIQLLPGETRVEEKGDGVTFEFGLPDENESGSDFEIPGEIEDHVKDSDGIEVDKMEELLGLMISSESPLSEFEGEDEETLVFSCKVEWLEAVASSKIITDSQENIEMVKEKIGLLKEKFESTGIGIYIGDANTMMDKGLEYAQEGDIVKGLRYFESAKEINPYSTEIDRLRAKSLDKLGVSSYALDVINEALSETPRDGTLLRTKIEILSEMGENDEYLKTAAKLTETNEEDPRGWWHRAKAAKNANGEARETFAKNLLRADDINTESIDELGAEWSDEEIKLFIMATQGYYDHIQRTFKQNRFEKPWESLCATLRMEGTNFAKDIIQDITDCTAGNDDELLYKSECLLRAGEEEQALDCLNEIENENENQPWVDLHRAAAYSTKDKKKAFDFLRNLLDENEKMVDAVRETRLLDELHKDDTFESILEEYGVNDDK